MSSHKVLSLLLSTKRPILEKDELHDFANDFVKSSCPCDLLPAQLFGVVVISVIFAFFQPLFKQPPVVGETFMNVIIGAVLCGLGIGLVFVHNGSTGGTDIVAAVASKKSNVTIGRAMMYFDLCIISSSLILKFFFVPDFSFQAGVPSLVYGLITLFVIPFMADMVIHTNRQAVQFTIFSPKWEEIATAINNEAQRDRYGRSLSQSRRFSLCCCLSLR